jgi:hypothetical protein
MYAQEKEFAMKQVHVHVLKDTEALRAKTFAPD